MQVADYVRNKAYHRFMKRGGHHGEDLNDWLEAERQVPQRAVMGYRPVRTDGNLDNSVLEPGIQNWLALFTGPRRPLNCEHVCQRCFVSLAWIDEINAPHSNGEFPDEDAWERMSPYPFPSVYDLAHRDVTIQFHGPVLIRWEVTLSHGRTHGLDFRFMRHPETCCVEVPRVNRPTPFRCLSGTIREFRKGLWWADSLYNQEGMF